MPKRTSPTGSELFIVDNSKDEWKVLRYLHDWCQLSKAIDVATGYFEIGALLSLKDEWQKVDHFRILMGDEVSHRTKSAFVDSLKKAIALLDGSIEAEKQKNDFLVGVPAIVDALHSGKINCRVYRKDKFHAKAYLTHARQEVVGSFALVGSSNFTYPGLTENVELNVQITGQPVAVLQEWYEEHWERADDVTPEILRTIERHTRDYSPFDVYARSLHEFFRQREMTDREWLENKSKVYPILDQYQKDGFRELMAIADKYRGAFLCDGVGLGKTFIGLMVIEYLIERRRKRVVLLVPKAARVPVWESVLARYAPHLRGGFSTLEIVNHTDLLRKASADKDYPALIRDIRDRADAIVIDEAHHFRNPGIKATKEGERQSHYWQLYDITEGKDLFFLTATPINNKLIDLQHMIEFFSRRESPDYFKDAPLGIHSLAGHFRKMEKELEKLVDQQSSGEDGEGIETNEVEAEQVLSNDDLFRALVVQRSRGYVKKSQQQNATVSTIFPIQEGPKVEPYSIKKTYGRLLSMVEAAFSKEKQLFSLAIYYPLAYPKGPITPDKKFEENRQKQVVGLIRTQFLKRFESSARAFEISCENLLLKLLAWVTKHSQTAAEKRQLERWKLQHEELIAFVRERKRELSGEEPDDEADEDVVSEEMLEAVENLAREEFRVEEILAESFLDLNQLAEFLNELKKFKPAHDDKLRALIELLKSDAVLKKHKVLIFTEYMATARYLRKQLEAAGIDGVDEVDSSSKHDRGQIIRQFSPYYNGSSSAALKAEGLAETRVLISTDVLSEGLNLQDATRLINYDLHWNPVRLMQRIGRVDRRLNPDTEAAILADHPDQKEIRRTVAYWNFLPPDELDELLRLYARVTHKVLRISKTFGIEGKKLLRPEDDYQALKDFTHAYEGTTSPIEQMRLEYQKLLKDYPDLLERINSLPGRVFSGKAHPSSGAQAIFLCFAMPAPPAPAEKATALVAPGFSPADAAIKGVSDENAVWSEDSGDTRWYLFDVKTEKIAEDSADMVKLIRCTPDTARKRDLPEATLSEIRAKVEKHIKNTYLKQVQAPIGVKPTLKAWMELS